MLTAIMTACDWRWIQGQDDDDVTTYTALYAIGVWVICRTPTFRH